MAEHAIDALAAVSFAELPDAQPINARLVAAFEREKNADGVRRTHRFHGRFENTYISAEKLPELSPINEFVLATARRLLGQGDLRHGFWFNEMQPGHKTTLHSHEELDERLSAVYYVTCPEHSGRLILHDDHARISIVPRPGLLVLFPPDLPHEVEENRSTQVRLSIAFNFGPSNSAL